MGSACDGGGADRCGATQADPLDRRITWICYRVKVAGQPELAGWIDAEPTAEVPGLAYQAVEIFPEVVPDGQGGCARNPYTGECAIRKHEQDYGLIGDGHEQEFGDVAGCRGYGRGDDPHVAPITFFNPQRRRAFREIQQWAYAHGHHAPRPAGDSSAPCPH